MSGQPVKTASDQNKFRNEYLKTLSLQEKNNDYNLQANKNYLLTGQLPPSSQMQDTRTNAEKLADVEKLKQDIASNLKPIAESNLAYSIINKLINSPLNIDNSLFRFFAQRASSIVEQLKKMIPYGIAGDDNDVETIVSFIKNMYSEQQGKFQSTKSYLNNSGSQGTSSKVLNGNDINAVILGVEDINKQIEIISERGYAYGNIDAIATRLKTNLINLKNALPTSEEISLLLNDINDVNYNNPYPTGAIVAPGAPPVPGAPPIPYDADDMNAFYEFMEKMPKYSEAMSLIGKIKQYINSNNLALAEKGLMNLEQMFDLGITPALLGQFRTIKQRQSAKITNSQNIQAEQTREFIERQTKEQKDASKANKVYIVNPQTDPIWVSPAVAGAFGAPGAPGAPGAFGAMGAPPPYPPPPVPGQGPPVPYGAIPGAIMGVMGANYAGTAYNQYANAGNPPQVNEYGQYAGDYEEYDYNNPPEPIDYNYYDPYQNLFNEEMGGNYTNIPESPYMYNPNHGYRINTVKFSPNTGAPLIDLVDTDSGQVYSDMNFQKLRNFFGGEQYIPPGIMNALQGPAIGHGLNQQLRRGRPRGSGISKPKLSKPKTFVGFGINEINNKQLENGIVKIRRNTKTNYVDMPSRRVSKNLQGIIKTIVGGGMPKYDELGRLDEEEKEYLNKIVSRSDLNDRLSIPAPSKDQQEKDIHNFEVMKGQIMSGNDSKEMVRKFKLLIRKLSKQQLLPKTDVEDLLDILGDLGY